MIAQELFERVGFRTCARRLVFVFVVAKISRQNLTNQRLKTL
ncbi:MAG: hypothetical protein BWX86_00203 [Verrucomicrobia bacterium ADurb.Bin122]|nr:MAG: hypothetical protein BWX86_00203 [Verrucomicrobia bacterium ADurb.Bin122]